MILVVEPNLKQVRMWVFDGAAEKTPRLVVKEFDELIGAAQVAVAIREIVKRKKLEAIAFRIVFGADAFKGPARINAAFFKEFNKLVTFFPFYIPSTEQLLKSFYESYPKVPLIAFFETSFFRDLPEEEKYYPIPHEYLQRSNIKRYGFHGIFHEAASLALGKERKIISIVLDRQTTISSIHKGKPLSISQGYTPLEGVMGRTSCGDLDPGIVFYLMKRYKYSIFQIDDMLKKESGFLGLTGYDLTMSELFGLYGTDAKVTLAFDIYQNQILKYIGEGISTLGGLDAIVFAGEYADLLAPLMYSIIKKISFLGLSVQSLPWKGVNKLIRVSSDDSKIEAYCNRVSMPQTLCLASKEYL
ncbi:MAG: hypothetical protein WCG78_03020 [Candidatus Omnitrophota bacterium]